MTSKERLNLIIGWECGGITEEETLKLFSHLIKTGLAYQLQGCYGRYAQGLIEAGYISRNGDILRNA